MKILIVNGLPPFAWDQAQSLYQAGHDVRCLQIDIRGFWRLRKYGVRRDLRQGLIWYVSSFPCGPLPYPIYRRILRYAGSVGFKKILKEWRPDLVHAHFSANGYAVADTCRENGIPLVVTEHSSGIQQARSKKELAVAKLAYEKANKVLAVSSALAKKMNELFGVSAEIVPNVLDPTVIAGYKAKSRGCRFISAGNLIKRKNFALLIRAFSKANIKNATLDIYGSGPLQAGLLCLRDDLGLKDIVTIHPRVSRDVLFKAYQESDFFVLASNNETFGVVYIEAMACGLPVIATRCGGPEDFLDETNGLMVPVGDETALAKALVKITQTPFDRTAITQRAIEKFSPKAIARRLTSIYRNLLRKPSTSVEG